MRKIVLFTDEFPFGFGEEYLTPEARYLFQKAELSIVTLQSNKPRQKMKDCNVPIYRINRDISSLSKIRKIRYTFRCVLKKYFWQEIISIMRRGEKVSARIYDALLYACSAEYIYDELKTKINLEKNMLLYTYWMTPLTLSLIIHYSKEQFEIISRVHGYDLYHERRATGWQPFRNYMNSKLDNIYFACEYGRQYYIDHYNIKEQSKLQLARLGAKKYYENSEYSKSKTFRLYSCSSLHPLKRVSLIIDALADVENILVEWVHIGWNDEYKGILEYAKGKLEGKNNVTYCFLGRMENLDIHRYLSTHCIDAMITISASEGGCPVSIQEAMAYGVPIIGTSVGGITEMIKGNGVLLSENPSKREIITAIQSLSNMKEEEITILRNRSLELWRELFDAEKNVIHFSNKIGVKNE